MSIVTSCPHCGASAGAPDTLAGKKARCSRCKEIFTVPERFVDLELVRDMPAAANNPVGGDGDLPMFEEVTPIASPMTTPPVVAAHPTTTGLPFASGFVYCRECGKQISRKAVACPVCGAPTEADKTPVRRPPPDPAYRSPLLENIRAASAQRIMSARTPNYVLAVAAFIVLVGMFLPWIDLVIISLNGFDLTQLVKMGTLAEETSKVYSVFATVFSFHYLLPIVAIAIIGLELIVIKHQARFTRTITALTFLLLLIGLQLLFFLVFGGAKKEVWQSVGFGYWLTVAGALTGVIADIVKSGFRGLTATLVFAVFAYYGILFALIKSAAAGE